jgi:hypothetical protein
MRPAVLAALLLAACGGTTGSNLVSFRAMAGGAADATSPLTFDTAAGYHVSLTRARLRIGAVYLNQSTVNSGAGPAPCILPGIYVAEAFGPVTVDLLSPVLQPFPTLGEGTATPAKTAEVWLTGGDVNARTDPTVIFDVAGTATKGGVAYPFQGTITISDNWGIPTPNPALPGANPICKQRIATPILVDFTPTDGGLLTLRIRPSGMFQDLDFATLSPAPGSSTLAIPDGPAGAGSNLHKGLLANSGVYEFSWSG